MQEENLKSMNSSFDDKNLNNTKEEKDNKPSIKILVGYHKPAVLLKDEILTPIHLGRALATEASKDGKLSQEDYEWLCENMIGDDTGDNISHLNRYFCELTGIYWAWKNYDKLGNPDYIGFMHYRRQFVFDENPKFEPKWLIFSGYNKYYYNHTANYKERLYKLLANNDIMVAHHASFAESVEEQYKNYISHIDKDFDLLSDFINSNLKENFALFEDYANGHKAYFANMFIMKKELFFKYCEFIFDICFKLHEKIDYTGRNAQFQRAIGFLSESITGFYYELLKKQGKDIKELPIALLLNTDLEKELYPAFEKDNIALVFACDNNYADYLSVTLQSIIENSSNERNYDIIILDDDINETYKSRLKLQCKKENFSLRFINIQLYTHNYNDLFKVGGHYSTATYYRFFLADILKNYKKALYLDSDIIVKKDIYELFKIDLKDKFLAATKDIYIKIISAKDKKMKSYLSKSLKLDENTPYFQAGILLLNLEKLRKEEISKLLIYNLQNVVKKPKIVDQCVLNYTLKNKVLYIDNRFNFDLNIQESLVKHNPFILSETLNEKEIKEYESVRKEAFIVHYAGPAKPWNLPYIEKADIWWSYARKTPFYEEILYKALANPYKAGAKNQIQSHLSYKLGQELMSVKKNKAKILLLPLSLIFIYMAHLLSRLLNHLLAYSNASIRPEPLHHYSDYHQALRIKDKHLSYRLGNLLVKHPFTFIFRANKVYKEWRRKRDKL